MEKDCFSHSDGGRLCKKKSIAEKTCEWVGDSIAEISFLHFQIVRVADTELHVPRDVLYLDVSLVSAQIR